jgi:hypothetical protein
MGARSSRSLYLKACTNVRHRHSARRRAPGRKPVDWQSPPSTTSRRRDRRQRGFRAARSRVAR